MGSVLMKFLHVESKNEFSIPKEVYFSNYNENYKLKPAYVLNGNTYNDDGRFNDRIAGDNIYTSVKKFNTTKSIKDNSQENGWYISDKFKFRNAIEKNKIKIGCKFRHVDCPDDGGFWSSDWGTGWGCVEFYDCEIEVEI